MKAKYLISGAIITVFLVWGIIFFTSTAVKYVPIEDVRSTAGAVQVMGEIDSTTVMYDLGRRQLRFEIVGLEEKNAAQRLKVVYSGTIPANFAQVRAVIVRGHYHDGLFEASDLLVKCPSQYQSLQKER